MPDGDGQSLYLRPLLFATEPVLQVRPSSQFSFFVLDSPSGSYFTGGAKPVTVWVSEDYSRAAPGGTGAAKAAGNYAASLAAQLQAQEAGCEGVVWLDAVERSAVEEMGGMNLVFVFGTGDDVRLVTPELTGTILAGVTRDSILQLGRDLGYGVEERRITMDEWRRGNEDGSITEVFACGTAAVITRGRPREVDVGRVQHQRRCVRPGRVEAARDPARHPARHRARPARLAASRPVGRSPAEKPVTGRARTAPDRTNPRAEPSHRANSVPGTQFVATARSRARSRAFRHRPRAFRVVLVPGTYPSRRGLGVALVPGTYATRRGSGVVLVPGTNTTRPRPGC